MSRECTYEVTVVEATDTVTVAVTELVEVAVTSTVAVTELVAVKVVF